MAAGEAAGCLEDEAERHRVRAHRRLRVRERRLDVEAQRLGVRRERRRAAERGQRGAQQRERRRADGAVAVGERRQRGVEQLGGARREHLRVARDELQEAAHRVVAHVGRVVLELADELAERELAVAHRLAALGADRLVGQHDRPRLELRRRRVGRRELLLAELLLLLLEVLDRGFAAARLAHNCAVGCDGCSEAGMRLGRQPTSA